ncbi:MAG: Type 1 glutamine amidotransferase-like domain-containing protein [Bacteroidetes bacterium]|nr:Type 1 glutamine amidotransferase-like domain-containing protein [Bacteroidota bacterium]
MKTLLTTLLLIYFVQTTTAQTLPLIGPKNGSLILIGGGFTTNEMIDRMAELMGGFDKPLVVCPTAAEPTSIDTATTRQQWINYGFSDVTVLHTTDTNLANTDSFVAPLLDASGVWFGGGRQWRLVDAYMGTKTLEEFHKVLERGGLIAGSSAGASIQASFLARGAVSNNTMIISPELEHRVGFGFLRNSAVDQHVDTRDRWEEMAEIIELDSNILGFGLSEATAMVVIGDCFEVIGLAQLAITDSTRLNNCLPGDTCYELLVASDSFNMQTRLKGSCVFDSLTTINEVGIVDEVVIYPNPSDGTFYLNSSDDQIKFVKVFNMLGVEIFSQNSFDQGLRLKIDIQEAQTGSYMLQLLTDEGVVAKKIMVLSR